ncbi:nickel ABC transporter permease subunit NikB [Anaerobacillus alkalidiazotrophicus]|uniref:Nickel import system permease protein NikB n=1 Tax=Anaerobacillus alkalidiazotrophicus TaxID=472963 RepID=A0A1S2MC85_9BACI|nr:nickel ABC transporter permease [Anaerobacillus alkalidiazotrophicus]OIJ22206.1 nickel ABC transporter permease subunit NikB [Anaerobacillus alkalidiazotrophicus]
MHKILSIIASRITQLVIMVLVLSFVTFLLMKVTPGDPIRAILKVEDVITTTAEEERLMKEYGFDQPIYIQYSRWLWGVVQFDLGESIISKKPVLEMIMNRLPATISLSIGGLVVLFLISIPFGIVGAIYENRWPDYLTRWFALIGASVPSFWLGLLLIYFFSLKLNLLPVMGKGTFAHFVLPSITLGVAMAPIYIRLLRERLISTLQSPYIEAAKARGLRKERILIFHALRGSLIPVVTMFGLSIGSLLGGITVIEILFSWPGMGDLIVNAVMQRDYPVIQGYILIVGLLVVVTNLIVDLMYLIINPQIKQGKEAA